MTLCLCKTLKIRLFVLIIGFALYLNMTDQTKTILKMINSYKQRNKNMWFPNLLDEVFNQNLVPATSLNIPAVNIIEFENQFEIDLAIPGKKKEDFSLEVDEDILIIDFTEKNETNEDEEKGKFTRKEFNYNSFRRTFSIPENVNQEDIKVSYVDGILKFELPKKVEEPQKEKRRLSIA